MIDMARAFALLAANPARLLGVEAGVLASGCEADIALVDARAAVDRRFATRWPPAAGNTPFDRRPVQGRVTALFKGGTRVKSDPADPRSARHKILFRRANPGATAPSRSFATPTHRRNMNF